jgi:hypothetical protein
MSSRTVYYVVLHEKQWKIKLGDKHYGPYATQSAAIKVAIDTAHKNGEKGFPSQVLVQGENNQWRTEWTYGNDPYPPKG